MSCPKINGVPLYCGKRRVYKKKLGRYFKSFKIKGLSTRFYKSIIEVTAGEFLQIGSLYNDCDGMNHYVREISLDRNHKNMIIDFTIINEVGGCCSFLNCCPEKAKTVEEIFIGFNEAIAAYPNDEWNFKERFSKIKLDENGVEIRE